METTMKVYYYYGGELYHHGVQGQKWGVRRYQNPDGTLTDKGRKRYGVYENRMSKEEGFKRGVKADKLVKIGKGINIASMSITSIGTMAGLISAGKMFAMGNPGLAVAALSVTAAGVGLKYLITKGVMKLSSSIAKTTDVDRQVYKNAENGTFKEEPKSYYKNVVKPNYKEGMRRSNKILREANRQIMLGNKKEGIAIAESGYAVRNTVKNYKDTWKKELKNKR